MATARVVLVHGLWMHGLVFAPLRWRLRRCGLISETFTYPTVSSALDSNAGALAARLRQIGGSPPHLVGHSMGGLLILRMLLLEPRLPVGRIVLLGSPVRGSRLARLLERWPPTSRVLGRTMGDWLHLPPARIEPGIQIGVVAGTRSLGIGRFVPSLATPNDGVVAVTETVLDEAADHLTLPVSHSQMLISKPVAEAVVRFLENGSFSPDGA